jgi:histidyl-tRNA synthetase
MSKIQTPRGMKDITPNEFNQWRRLRVIVEEAMDKLNYGFLTTPIVENIEVFNKTVGADSDILSKEMYVFEDRGNNKLALRPEGTASVCRAYMQHNMESLNQPVRLAYFGPMFRYDRPQANRYRQLWQFGAECIGKSSPEIDAELIYLQNYIFSKLSLPNYSLKINSLGGKDTRNKFEVDFKKFLKKEFKNLSKESQNRYEINPLRIFDSKERNDQDIIKNAPKVIEYLSKNEEAHFNQVLSLLTSMKINYSISPTIVRGLDYYTDTVWEFEPEIEGSQSTIGAGGRYDHLIQKLGGKDTPGSGFATGIERTLLLSNLPKLDQSKTTDIYLLPLNNDASNFFFKTIELFTKSNYSFIIGDYRNSIRSQLRAANNLNAKYAFIVGEKEYSQKTVTIKYLNEKIMDKLVQFKDIDNELNNLSA